jgi:hypothetical protein
MNVEYFMIAAVIVGLASLVCFYSAKYELVKLGVSTEFRWRLWPPAMVDIWKAGRMVQGRQVGLWFWAIALWVYWLIALVMLPFVVYYTIRGFTG